MSQAFYAFYAAPVSGGMQLLTGAHVYGLVAVAVLGFVTLHWRRHWEQAPEQNGSSAHAVFVSVDTEYSHA
jgi:hypothetical protein